MTAIRYLGTWRNEDSRYVRTGGAWRKVTGISVHTGGAWKTAAGYVPAFSASAPDEVDGFGYSQKPVSQRVTATAAISVSGGQSPYSYQWTRTGGDNRIVADVPTSASTNFIATLRNETAQANFSWLAKDSSGQSFAGTTLVVLEASSG